jgi:hypothetical protein
LAARSGRTAKERGSKQAELETQIMNGYRSAVARDRDARTMSYEHV